MKNLTTAMISALGAEASRLCFCWKVTRTDGVVQGFTDHNKNLTFDSVTYLASDGIEATTISQSLGLAVDNLNLNGAISSTSLNEADLDNGLYNDAEVELFLVDWSNVSTRMIIARGSIGEVKRFETAFSAEFRSLAHRLNQKSGRTYQRYCDANLGDSRCTKNLNSSAFTLSSGAVTSANGRFLSVTGAAGYDDGWFDRGLLTVLTGGSAGLIVEVKEHKGVSIELWTTPSSEISVGDTVKIAAGCDKSYSTCKNKFSNGVNFRGFPYIPGNDILTWVASPTKDDYDGGSLFQ
jgi:uncharacterized phage protein (TIGR02218 family)